MFPIHLFIIFGNGATRKYTLCGLVGFTLFLGCDWKKVPGVFLSLYARGGNHGVFLSFIVLRHNTTMQLIGFRRRCWFSRYLAMGCDIEKRGQPVATS